LPPHAEVLTESGWVKFRDYEGQPVAQWDNGELSMVKPTAVVEKPYNGDLITYQWRGYKHTSTPGHRMPVIVKSGELTETTAEKGHATGQIPRVGILDGPGIDLTDDEIRLLVAISADGRSATTPDGSTSFRRSLRRGSRKGLWACWTRSGWTTAAARTRAATGVSASTCRRRLKRSKRFRGNGSPRRQRDSANSSWRNYSNGTETVSRTGRCTSTPLS